MLYTATYSTTHSGTSFTLISPETRLNQYHIQNRPAADAQQRILFPPMKDVDKKDRYPLGGAVIRRIESVFQTINYKQANHGIGQHCPQVGNIDRAASFLTFFLSIVKQRMISAMAGMMKLRLPKTSRQSGEHASPMRAERCSFVPLSGIPKRQTRAPERSRLNGHTALARSAHTPQSGFDFTERFPVKLKTPVWVK